MDKYEYKLTLEEIASLIREKQYIEAADIADGIDWRNEKSSKTLCMISDLYKKCKRYEDSRDVLMLAYQRNPNGRMILYSLCELSLKLRDIVNAYEYLKEFSNIAPKDPGKYILNYKLLTLAEASLEERIQSLEQLQEVECRERWMYELAHLYMLEGNSSKCVEECNQIIIYFGEGKYVIKALELKATYEPLSSDEEFLLKQLTNPRPEITVNHMDESSLNAIDLQKELANSMAEVLREEEPAKAEEPSFDIPVVEAPAYEEPVSYEETKTDKEPETTVEPEVSEAPEFNTESFTEKYGEEPGVAKTIVPSHGRFDEMREVLPQNSKVGSVIYPNYEDMVSLQGDGQLSFNIPEQEVVEKQITGQISIEDVLAEWERLRSASEQTWRENMRKMVIKQTSDIFKDFDESSKSGLLEQLESEVEGSKEVKLTDEEEKRLEEASPEGEETIIFVEDVSDGGEGYIMAPLEGYAEVADTPQIDTDTEEPEDIEEATEEPAEEEEPATEDNETEVPKTEASDNADEATEATEASDIREIIIPDVEPEAVPEEETVTEPETEEKPSLEELSFDRTPFLNDQEEDDTSATRVLPSSHEIDSYLLAFAEASEKSDAAINVFAGAEEVEPYEPVKTEILETDNENISENFVSEKPEEDSEEAEDSSEPEESYSEAVKEAIKELTGEAEEVEEDSFEAEEADKEENFEVAEEEPEEEAEEEYDDYPAIRDSGFTEEQEERFESYIQTEDAREQLREVLDNISTEAAYGNVIVGSEDIDSAVDFSKRLILELSETEPITGKIAKVKASSLNAKAPAETLTKIYDGALIVQDAQELKKSTLEEMNKALNVEGKKLFVILMMSKRTKHRFIMENKDLLENFDVSFDIEALNNKELARYARAYAYSREFAIDEMGMLALHTRIEGKQTNEHSVTASEVRAIVDEAIYRATRKNVNHFVDILFGKRYDENDMVVLKEKDFVE